MFGGMTFMVSGNMCCGIVDDRLIARIGTDQYPSALKKYVHEMDFTGKSLKGFVYIDPQGFESNKDLSCWLTSCSVYLDFTGQIIII